MLSTACGGRARTMYVNSPVSRTDSSVKQSSHCLLEAMRSCSREERTAACSAITGYRYIQLEVIVTAHWR
jgi:hypothetical protein